MSENERAKPTFAAMRAAAPKAVTMSSHALVRERALGDGENSPLVVEPDAVRINLAEWAAANRARIGARLLERGAILFRGFAVDSVERFDSVARAVTPDLLEYRERAAPRTEVRSRVYTSTEFPADQEIPLHHEMSYSHNWPSKIWFHCAVPAPTGGCTPVASERAFGPLLDPAVREELLAKGVMYVRNYGEGVDLPWQTAFQTSDRAEVEAYLRAADTELEWRDGDRLRTRRVGRVTATHPRTGETVWFNHAHMFHDSNLQPAARAALLAEFAPDEFPRNVFFGDGTAINAVLLDEVRGAYRRAAIAFPWERGDVLLLDNVLVAHGREPFAGPRSILVAMAELTTYGN